MTLASVAAITVVLAVAGCAGVAFACCCGGSSASLVWLNPSGSAFPVTHPGIGCAESGGNTAKLDLSATHLGPGDGCQFAAKLHNTGNQWLRISVVTKESTPRGAPAFSSCFGFTLSSGPSNGKIAGGASYPYTFTVELLSSATSACENVVGTVSVTFTGTPA